MRGMKYACLVYLETAKLRVVPDSECMQFGNGLRQTGAMTGGEALQPAATAATVRVRDGKMTVTDGPFAETKEQLAGFYLLEAASMEDAITMAAAIPPAREGSIEVRLVRDLEP